MIEYIRQHLGAKLFLSYLLVLVAGGFVLATATTFTAPPAFDRHLGMMQQAGDTDMMEMMEGNGLRRGQRAGNPGDLFQNFKDSIREALTWAGTIAGLVALVVSLYLSRQVVKPVRDMMNASQHIATGEYNERVQEHGKDELGQLAKSFNLMAERLEHTEDMRRQLIGDVAHELRTPLTYIKGSMEGLIDDVLPATLETYQLVHQEAERLNRLVSDLQELSRVETGSLEMDLHSVQFNSLVEVVGKRLGTQFAEKNVRLAIDIRDDLPAIRADDDRIIQVLTNLLTNALRYAPEAGVVSLSASRENNFLRVSVSDTGIGIPPEHLPHIFTRFYRVDKSRSRQAGGSGIGLTITRHLVEAHGGRIWAESSGQDLGTTFIFTLPLAE